MDNWIVKKKSIKKKNRKWDEKQDQRGRGLEKLSLTKATLKTMKMKISE